MARTTGDIWCLLKWTPRVWYVCVLLAVVGPLAVHGSCPLHANCPCVNTTVDEIRAVTCSDLGDVAQLPELSPVATRIRTFTVDSNTCNVTRLQPQAFAGLRIRALRLANIHLRSIDKEAFTGVDYEFLEELYLEHNELTDIALGTFSHLSTLIQLHLSYNNLQTITEWNGMVSLRYLHLKHNNIATLTEASFNGLDSLVYLSMLGNQLSYLPDGVFQGLKQLEVLNIRENQLQALPHRALWGLKRVTRFDFSVNNLTELHEDVFVNNRDLNYLDLADNNLISLPQTLFAQLENLEYLDLSLNKIEGFHSQLFGSTRKLSKLFMEYNAIKALPQPCFEQLGKLMVLHLHENQIESFAQNNLLGLISLREFDIHGNKLRHLPLGVLDPLGALRTMDLSYNQLYSFEGEKPFSALKHLTHLNLSFNGLFRVSSDLFEKQTKLVSLKLNNNRINMIDEKSFVTLEELQELDLSSNWIHRIYYGLFTANGLLRELKLSKNPLSEVVPDAFTGLNSLQTLYMNNTCLSTITDQVFTPLNSSLRELYLQDNNLTALSADLFVGLLDLRVLSLAHNAFSNIDPGVFRTLSFLHYLNLSASNLRDGHLSIFDSLNQLQSLDISWNKLNKVPYTSFQRYGEKYNFELYLHMNKLYCDCNNLWLRDFTGLADRDSTVCLQGGKAKLAVCYTSPTGCGSVSPSELASQANVCGDGDRAVDWDQSPPPAPEVDIYVCDLSQYVTTTPTPPTTTPSPRPVYLSHKKYNDTSIVLTWSTEEERHEAFMITYRLFGEDQPNVTWAHREDSSYTLYDLTPNRNYIICIHTIMNNKTGQDGTKHCKEIGETQAPEGLPTGPTTQEEKGGLKTPLILIIAVVGGTTAVVAILVAVYFAMKHYRQKKLADDEEDSTRGSTTSLRRKAAMWVNSFQFDGQLNEQVAEQSTLTWNLMTTDTMDWKRNPKITHIA